MLNWTACVYKYKDIPGISQYKFNKYGLRVHTNTT